MPRLTVRLLGNPRIEFNGRRLETDRRKVMALLAYLCLEKQAASRDTLAAFFWPDAEASKGYAYLRRTLWEINQFLGKGGVEAGREMVGLGGALELWVDVKEFESRAAAPTAADQSSGQISALAEAASLYRGDFMAGFSLRDSPNFDDWQLVHAENLRQRLGQVLEELAAACASQGETETAIAHARRRLSLDNLNEDAHRQLMLLYARASQKSAALRQYDACQRLLDQALNIPPEPATTELAEQIRKGGVKPAQPALLETLPKASSAQTTLPAARLPVQPSPFIGRQVELNEIAALLADPQCRLLTLVGQGGIGKTRLALQAASLLDSGDSLFPNGVVFIPLAAVDHADQLAARIASELGVAPTPQGHAQEADRDRLLDFLRSKCMLLVLDNLEQVVEGTQLFSEILAAAPGIKILATSRMRLNLPEEQALEVKGMAFPEKDSPGKLEEFSALQLFIQNARKLNVESFFTESDLLAVSDICRMVEGMPLGIELAAAWVRTLSCQEIALEMRGSLDFLTTSQPGVIERHRSLRAVFEHSWRLLTEVERAGYRKLAVFRGGFRREAAAQVAGASLQLLSGLIDASLVHRLANGRYDLHETLRQYAAEKLEEVHQEKEQVLESHSEYYLSYLAEMDPLLKDGGQVQALDLLDAEMENLQSAWNWALANGRMDLLHIAIKTFVLFFNMRSRFEETKDMIAHAARQLRSLHAAHPSDADTTTMLALILASQAGAEASLGVTSDLSRQETLKMSLALPGSPERAFAMLLIDFGLQVLREAEAESIYRECLQEFRAAGDEHAAALADFIWNYSSIRSIDAERGPKMRACLRQFEELNDLWGLSLCYTGLGDWASWGGRYLEARQSYENALDLFQQLGDSMRQVSTRYALGMMAMYLGDYTQALGYLQDNLVFLNEMGRRHHMASHCASIGYIKLLQGEIDLAREYDLRSLKLFREVKDASGAGMTLANLGDVARAGNELDLAHQYYVQGLEEIQRSENPYLDREWARSVVLKKLGKLELLQGKLEEAGGKIREALEIAAKISNIPEELDCLDGVALLMVKLGQPAAAVEILAAVLEHPACRKAFKDEVLEIMEKIILPPEQVKAARLAGIEKGVDKIVKSYLAALSQPL
jgi:predicted ATPase/DNA-binding SARP family transcriptional activator